MHEIRGFSALAYTVKASPSTSCNRFVIDKPISECVRMACDSLLTTSLLEVTKLIVKTCYPQACCKLFQRAVRSLEMASCNKLDFNRPVIATCTLSALFTDA